jgi:nickel-dependent lactate racemase
VARLPVLDHDSRDPSQLEAVPGTTSSGATVRLNRHYLAADLRILTGLVEPHFMAGYSGGRKAVFPGLTDLRAIRSFHGPRFLEDPRTATGVLEGNPCHREAADAARLAGADFILNVAIDRERKIVGVFAGELEAAFHAAAEAVGGFCRAAASRPADIVVTSGGGYPLDATFYQTVKGMVGALPVVREGGAVLIASACSEGIGNREYGELMLEYDGRHEDFLGDIQARDEVQQDQWEFEMQCKALARVGVDGLVVCTDGIPRDTLRRLSVTPGRGSLQETLDALLAARPGARVVAIPEGPYTLAELSA